MTPRRTLGSPVTDRPPAPAELDGLVVLVTGGSRGIGAAVADAVLAAGGSVCLTGRDAGTLRETADRLGGGDRVLSAPGDAADPGHRERTVDRLMARFGRLDAVVNNAAAAGPPALLVDSRAEDLRQAFETNVVAAWDWVRLAWDAWMGEHGGRVVNVASVAGLHPEPGIGAYAVSKAALQHLTRAMALELAPGVRVNAVAPGLVRTDATRPVWEGRETEVAAAYPLHRIGRPDDVAAVVRFLLGPAASWMTGQTLAVDGGHTVRLAPASDWLQR